MIPSTLFALVATLSSIVAVNGAVIQRDGTFVSDSELCCPRSLADRADVSDASAYGTRPGRQYYHCDDELAVV